jgi:hypothetical protein
MSDKTISPSKIILFLFFSLYSSLSYAAPNCKLQWGPSEVLKSSNCSFNKEAIAAPTSIYVNNFKWNTISEVFTIELTFKNIQLLSGLKLSFYNRGEEKASYTLPLYSDPEYNIIKEGIRTRLSIPKSDLVWSIPEFKDKAVFDGLTVYIGTKVAPQKKLSLRIEKTYTSPRHSRGKISITFDDGYASNYQAALIMKPYNLTGTAYIIPDAIGQNGHLNLNQLAKMKQLGWSLSSHLTTPVTQIKNLREVLLKTKKTMSKWGTPQSASHFALPLGKYDQKSLKALSLEFKSIRLAGGRTEVLPIQDRLRLKTINVTHKMKPQEVFEKCVKAVKNKEWAILMFHYIDRPEKGDLNYSSKDYKELMKLLRTYSKSVQTVEQVLKDQGVLNE